MYYNFYKIIKYLYIIVRFPFSVNYTYLLELSLMAHHGWRLTLPKERLKVPQSHQLFIDDTKINI